MDNLEINLAIAIIECVVIEHITNTDKAIMVCSEDVEQEYKLYNPLTDDALCFQLMVKYSVMVEQWVGKYIAYYNASVSEEYDRLEHQLSVMDDTPNKAILLAII